ncbi:hypothetical protein ACJW30_09G054300 [Castanea mollissima]
MCKEKVQMQSTRSMPVIQQNTRKSNHKQLRVHNIGSVECKRNQTHVPQRSMKFTKTVFFVTSRRTCGGLITVLRLSAASSGLFFRRMLNTLPRSCIQYQRKTPLLTTHDNTNRRLKIICKPHYPFPIHLRSIIDSHNTPAKLTLSSSDNLI